MTSSKLTTYSCSLSQILPSGMFSSEQLQAYDVKLSGIQSDSRLLTEGDVFLACKGLTVDGRDYIEQAIDLGVAAIIVEAGEQWPNCQTYRNVPLIPVPELAKHMSVIAANFYGRPTDNMTVVGVTGTNGKTTCSHYIAKLLAAFEQASATIGTLGWGGIASTAQDSQPLLPTNHTTPDAVEMQNILAELLRQNKSHVVMEVSSHGLSQGRVDAVAFESALFTNLSHDHLDYHANLQDYGRAKQILFEGQSLQSAVINIDDDFGCQLVTQLRSNIRCLTYSLDNPDADIFVQQAEFFHQGVDALLRTPWGEVSIHSRLIGRFNLSNVVASLAVLCNLGFDIREVAKHIVDLEAVVGRMQSIANSAGITVVIDYAHTPDALEKALVAMREHCTGKLWCVYGCGGNRDVGKRSKMGSIAAHLSDSVVVTSDNPRNEDPQSIIDDICVGFAVTEATAIEPDRKRAIQFAINSAVKGDSVLIAGKGHEDYQEIKGERLYFSDRVEIEIALQARAGLST